jgi:cobalt-zinc-cadmium efflux system outer membrane protein
MQLLNREFLVMTVLLAGFCRSTAAEAEAADANTNELLTIDHVLGEVALHNPWLKASRANWEAKKQRVPQARSWEDLRAGFDTVAGRFVEVSRNSFTDQKLTAEQTIPIAGKNRWRGTAAEADAIVSFQELRRKELDLAAKARSAFYRLVNANEQLRITDLNLELLREFTSVTRNKYESGSRPQSDVLAAETGASKLEESRYDLLRRISEAESQLNVLMNRPAQASVPRPAPLGIPNIHFGLEPLQSLALEHRPEVLTASLKIEAAKARLEVAKRLWIPEPSLRAEASRYNDSAQGVSEVIAGVSINIPWLHPQKYRAAIEEANQMKIAAEYELESARNETRGMVRDALGKLETYHHHVELFHDRILVLARQSASAARHSYETDKAPFLNLIDAQRTLQESEGMYWDHATDFLNALAELESIIGTDPASAANPHADKTHP